MNFLIKILLEVKLYIGKNKKFGIIKIKLIIEYSKVFLKDRVENSWVLLGSIMEYELMNYWNCVVKFYFV